MQAARQAYLYSIGIDKYVEFRTLSFCSADAVAIHEDFGEKLKAKDRVIINSQTDDISKSSTSAVKTLLSSVSSLKLAAIDIVVFYFAGHGFSTSGRDYLVCSDTSRSDLTSAIPTDDVISALVASGAGTSILIVDACRNEAERDIGRFGEATADLARRKGTIVFFGCSPGQTCKELSQLGHGVFTHSLLKAAKEHSPCTPTEIDRYAIMTVKQICSDNKLGAQEPYTCVWPLQKASVDIFTGEIIHLFNRKNRECILIVGPSNAGKTTIGQHLASKLGMVHVEMSSFAYQRYQEYKKHGNFPGSIQDFMERIVWAGGKKELIADDLIQADPGANRIVICGPRTVEEVERLRKHDWNCRPFFLYSNSHLRFDRYESSQSDRFALNYSDFVRKDLREYSWGLARAATLRNVDILINEDEISNVIDGSLRLCSDLA
jgi:adenylate kinase family enzyme